MTTPPDAGSPGAVDPAGTAPVDPPSTTPDAAATVTAAAKPAWRRWLDDPQHRKMAGIGAATALALIVVTRLASGGVGIIGPTEAGPGPGPTRTVAAGDLDIELLKRATVLITTHPSDPAAAGWGSGSIISRDGLILTNAHVAANRAPGLGVLFGAPISEGTMGPPSPQTHVIYTVTGDEVATPTYLAETVVADGYLDLAILRITALADGTPVTAADLDLTPVPLGSADDIRAGEELTVLGYPGIADSFRVHVTRGAFSNLKDDHLAGPGAWMNTDAKIAQGNSGGLAADEQGRLVGIPDRVRLDDRDFGHGRVRHASGRSRIPAAGGGPRGTAWDPYTYVTRPSGNERIDVRGWTATDAETCDANPAAAIPGGSTRLIAHVDFQSVVAGDHLLFALLRGSGADATLVDSLTYDWPRDATSDQCLTLRFGAQSAYPDGQYQLAVLIGPNYETEIAVGGQVAAVGAGSGPDPSLEPGPTVLAGSECDRSPVASWDGTPGGKFAGVMTPSIPYPSGEQDGGLTTISYELTIGPTDRRSAEQVALADRARAASVTTSHDRWFVVEVEGAYRAFVGEVWQPLIGTRVNPVLPCTLSEARARLVTSYASHQDFFGTGAYYHSAWTTEAGHTITDGNTGKVIVSGPGGPVAPADVPFLPGPETNAWLLANVTGRSLGVACETATPSASAWGNGAIAQVVCRGSAAYDIVAYTLYESDRALGSYWDGRVASTPSMLGTDVCVPGTWHYADNAADPKGGLLCERVTTTEGRPAAQIEWTEEDWRIAAFVLKSDGDLAALWGVWAQAGSLPRAP